MVPSEQTRRFGSSFRAQWAAESPVSASQRSNLFVLDEEKVKFFRALQLLGDDPMQAKMWSGAVALRCASGSNCLQPSGRDSPGECKAGELGVN